MPLTLEQQRHLTAAEGWLELGDHVTAFHELEQIQASARANSEVLKLRWRIYRKAQKWGNAFTVAEGLTRILPDDPEVFIWRSYAARRMAGDGLLHAYELLHDAVNDFPDEPCMPFNLACYACQLRRLPQALSWLHVAFEIAERNGTEKFWKTIALDEPDLEPLRRAWRIQRAMRPNQKLTTP